MRLNSRRGRSDSGAHPRPRGAAPRLVAALALLVGLLNLAAVLAHAIFLRLEFITDVLPGIGVYAPGVSVAVGLLLIGLAQGLSRGKRRAWRVAVVLLAAEVLLQVGQRHFLISAASFVLLVVVLASGDQFRGRSDPSTRRQAVLVGAGLLAVSVAIGLIAVSVLDRETHAGLSFAERLLAVMQGLLGIPSVVTSPDGRAADAAYYLMLSLGVLTVGVVGYLALRSSAAGPSHSPEDEQLLRRLIARWGATDSLAYFATRDDRSLIWDPGRRACVSYRVVSGTMLAAGDPLGPRAHWKEAIEAFLAVAQEHAWIPAVVAATRDGAQAWAKYGHLNPLEYGDEAVLHPETWSLSGREMRNVRQAVTRSERAGYSVRLRRLRDIPGDEAARLRQASDTWRAGDVERGFSMSLGRLDAVRDPDCLVVTAERDSRAEALLVFVPWGTDAASLDLMRRSPEADSGVNELMISRTVEAAPSLGITRISLNFAVFRDAIERSERIGAGPATRAWGRMLRAVSRWSQADTLYRFNAKFRPTWEPRFLAYQTATGLPRVAVAYLDAESLIRIPRWSFGRSGRVESARDLSTSTSGPDDGTSYRPRSPDTEETR